MLPVSWAYPPQEPSSRFSKETLLHLEHLLLLLPSAQNLKFSWSKKRRWVERKTLLSFFLRLMKERRGDRSLARYRLRFFFSLCVERRREEAREVLARSVCRERVELMTGRSLADFFSYSPLSFVNVEQKWQNNNCYCVPTRVKVIHAYLHV